MKGDVIVDGNCGKATGASVLQAIRQSSNYSTSKVNLSYPALANLEGEMRGMKSKILARKASTPPSRLTSLTTCIYN